MNVENFDDVLQNLRLHGGDTARISLSERTKAINGGKEGVIVVGNWDVPTTAAAQAPARGLDVTQEEEDDDTAEQESGHQTLPAWIATAASWLRSRATAHAKHYQRDAKFQVKLFRQGGSYIVSCTFLVSNVARGPEALPPTASYASWAAQQASLLDGIGVMEPALYPGVNEVSGAANQLALEVVGLTGSFLRNLVLPGVGQVVKLNEFQVLRLMEQIGALQRTIATLEGVVKQKDTHIADLDRQILLYESAEGADTRARIERAKTIGVVADKLGDLGKSYLAGKLGIPPEMMPLIYVVMQHRELAQALSDPNIAALLSDDAERATIVNLLQRLAAAYKANKEAAEAEKLAEAEKANSPDEGTSGATSNSTPPSMDAPFPDAS